MKHEAFINCVVVLRVVPKNITMPEAKWNKFALLWGEAQLCLPYVCL